MVEVKNLHKAFGSNRVLRDVSLSVGDGQIVSILGPSGTGKTTLLRCINFLEKPEQGTVTVNGITVNAAKAHKKDILALRRSTAMVFQSYNLFKNKTVLQNVAEALITVKKLPKAAAIERARAELARVGMADKAASYPSQISGGQQQRVAIARAMAMDPAVILFDEPTSALDPELSLEVLSAIREVAGLGIAMMIVTHEISFARDISHHLVLMDAGQIVEQGPPEQIFLSPREPRTRQFISRVAPVDFQI